MKNEEKVYSLIREIFTDELDSPNNLQEVYGLLYRTYGIVGVSAESIIELARAEGIDYRGKDDLDDDHEEVGFYTGGDRIERLRKRAGIGGDIKIAEANDCEQCTRWRDAKRELSAKDVDIARLRESLNVHLASISASDAEIERLRAKVTDLEAENKMQCDGRWDANREIAKKDAEIERLKGGAEASDHDNSNGTYQDALAEISRLSDRASKLDTSNKRKDAEIARLRRLVGDEDES